MPLDVQSVMTRQVVRVHCQQRVREALALLYTHGIRQLPVVDDTDRVVGIVTDRDLREHVGSTLQWEADPEARSAALDDPVEAVMTDNPVTVSPRMPLDDLIDLLIQTKYGGVPVVDAADRLVGIVTYIDVLRALRSR